MFDYILYFSQMENKKRFSISLTTQILIATAGGIVFGALVGEWASNQKFIGDIFIRLIQMSVVLLVMSAVASAVGGGDGKMLVRWDSIHSNGSLSSQLFLLV